MVRRSRSDVKAHKTNCRSIGALYIEAAEWLLTHHNFTYVLPGVFVDESLEKFFGQARQRNGGNFYIDIVDIKAAAETKNFHTFLKYESMPHKSNNVPCISNIRIDDYHFDITIADTEDLVQFNGSIKHKIIFLSGYLEHKFRGKSEETEDIDDHHCYSKFRTRFTFVSVNFAFCYPTL